MKLAIVGSRSITSIVTVKGAMILFERQLPYTWHDVTGIVSGGAKGVDALAKQVASESHITLTEFLPQYNKFRSATEACYARNQQIAIYCDLMIALWDGLSGGTIDVVKRARKLGKPVFFSPCWINRFEAGEGGQQRSR